MEKTRETVGEREREREKERNEGRTENGHRARFNTARTTIRGRVIVMKFTSRSIVR